MRARTMTVWAALLLTAAGCPRGSGESDAMRAEARYHQGVQHLHAGDSEAAVMQLQEAVEIDPTLTKAHHALGEAWIAVRYGDRAEKSFRQALAQDPAKFISWMGLGHALRLQGKHTDAAGAYRKAAEIDAEAADPHRYIGDVLAGVGDLNGAIESYRTASEKGGGGQSSAPLESLAELLEGEGRFADAARAWAVAVERTDAEAREWGERADWLAKQGRHEEVESARDRGATAARRLVGMWNRLGDLHARVPDLDRALEAYRKSLQLDGSQTVTWQVVGSLQHSLGDSTSAVASYQRARELSPRSAAVWEGLARLHLESGRQKEAREAVEAALGFVGGDEPDQVLFGIADVLGGLGDHARAEAIFRELLRTAQDDPQVWVALARQQHAQGRAEDRDISCAKARALVPEGDDTATAWCTDPK